MRYLVERSVVQVVGRIWMPHATAAMEYSVRPDDVRDDDGQITRESVEQWTTMHTGDFQNIVDFAADICDGPNDVLIPWADAESEFTFQDCMWPVEDDEVYRITVDDDGLAVGEER